MKRPTKSVRLDAIRPNQGIREWYRARLNEILRAARDDVEAILQNRVPQYGSNIEIEEIALDADWRSGITTEFDRSFARWIERISELSEQVAAAFVAKTANHYNKALSRQLMKKAGFTVPMQASEEVMRAMKAAVGENVGLIKSIPQQYLTDVDKYVWSAVEGGFDLSTLTDNLQHAYHISRNRAKLISRDQSNKVHSVMENERRKELGINKAIWRHSGAAKEPRQSHLKANGKEFDIDKGMYIDGEWIFPGQEINCGCISQSIIEI